MALSGVFLKLSHPTPWLIYGTSFVLGISTGYWSVFVTIAAEHFGTNMRATVATTVPNFSRGVVIPVTMLFTWLKPQYGTLNSGLAVGWIILIVAFLGWFGLRETFHDDLDYHES